MRYFEPIHMKTNRSRYVLGLLAFAFAGMLIACSEQSQQAAHTTPSQVVSSAATNTSQTATQILAAFNNDLKACQGVVRYRAEAPAKTDVNLQEPERLLETAPYAGTPEAAYFKANRGYVFVALSFHHDPLTVARFKEPQPFYCGITAKRLDDMEKLGAPLEGWPLWSHFLNLAVDHLEPLMDIGPGGDTVLWGWAQQKFERADALYAQTQREQLLAIAQRAASKVDASLPQGYRDLDELNQGNSASSSALERRAELDAEFKKRKAFIQGLVAKLQKAP